MWCHWFDKTVPILIVAMANLEKAIKLPVGTKEEAAFAYPVMKSHRKD